MYTWEVKIHIDRREGTDVRIIDSEFAYETIDEVKDILDHLAKRWEIFGTSMPAPSELDKWTKIGECPQGYIEAIIFEWNFK